MINYKEEIGKRLKEKISELELEEIKKMITVPTNSEMGDFSFPCFRLAKIFKKSPVEIAEEISKFLSGDPIFEKVEFVNGYVNMYLVKDHVIKNVLGEILDKKENYGKTNVGNGGCVIVDYSSPNIAKPFHIGHIRSTVIGNAIYKLHDAIGYDVVRINHLGDYGTQFGKMICAYRKWGNKEDVEKAPIKTLLSYYTKFHEEAEKDSNLDQEARDIFAKLEKGKKEETELWQWFKDESLKEFDRVYKMLDIDFDSYNGESFYSDKMPAVIDRLKEKNLLVKSEGADIVKLEDYNLTDAPIIKENGSSLYITRDLAAAIYRKKTYNFVKDIYVVASQQNLHFQQLKKIIELMGFDWADQIIHVPFGMVSIESGSLSTRKGRVVFLEDLLNKAVEKTREVIKEKGVVTDNIDETAKMVGIGAVVFNELSNNRIKDYVFSYDNVLNFDGETGPYVQYTYARCASILRKAEMENVSIEEVDTKYIDSESCFELTKRLYEFPAKVVDAAEKYEPSILTRHIVDIAQGFNKFYHDEHILVDDEKERNAKLALVIATKDTIKNGMGFLGIKCPDKM